MRGTKYRISDFAAAVLMAQLTRLDDVCATREKHAAYLKQELRQVPGLMAQEHYPQSTRQNYYVFGLRYDPEHFKGLARAKFIEAMRAEGIPIGGLYPPLNKEPFLDASLNSRHFQAAFSKERLDRYREQNRCPNNDKLCATCLSMSHEVLIGTQRDVDDVLEACAKVQKYSATA